MLPLEEGGSQGQSPNPIPHARQNEAGRQGKLHLYTDREVMRRWKINDDAKIKVMRVSITFIFANLYGKFTWLQAHRTRYISERRVQKRRKLHVLALETQMCWCERDELIPHKDL